MDFETETCGYWAKDVDTETPSRLSLISDSVAFQLPSPPNTHTQPARVGALLGKIKEIKVKG